MKPHFKLHILFHSLIAVLFIITAFSFFLNIAKAATKYWFNAGADAQWTTLTGNWWDDVDHLIQSASLPTNSDVVVTLGVVGPEVNLDTWAGAGNINATATGISFTATSLGFPGPNVDIIGSVTFNGPIRNYQGNTITGNAIFNGLSTNGGVITGTATHNSAHAGVLTIGSGGVWWGGTAGANVGDDTLPITLWVFNSGSNNQGVINGDAIFNGNSSSSQGSISGDVTFNDTSANSGSILSNAFFNDLSFNNGGLILGVATYANATGGIMTIPNGGAWGGDTSGTIVGIDSVPITSWIFNGNSINWGTLPEATFNSLSRNEGVITGTATYNSAHAGVMTINTGGAWGGGSAALNVGDEAVPITSFVFNGSSNTGSFIPGDSTFYDSSYNNATVSGNATFYDSSSNLGGDVLGDATFYEDLTEMSGGNITGLKTRIYTSNAIVSRDFVSSGPWTVVADGAMVNIIDAVYDTDSLSQTYTTLTTLNGGTFITSVETPTSNPTAGSYSENQNIILSGGPESDKIYYTTDGTTPDCSPTDTLYSGSISISTTTTIKAVSCDAAGIPHSSSVGTFVFTIHHPSSSGGSYLPTQQQTDPCLLNPSSCVQKEVIKTCTEDPTKCLAPVEKIKPKIIPPPPPPNPTSPSTPVTQPITEIIPITTPPIQIQTPPSPLKTFLKLLTKDMVSS
ncbi:MAG: chitobiase/beta-hexosaminidase C-terminal domain-containing protein [Candidatus Nomurabacteria bacterium]|nr:chitobiase/beta-hexosaminidase C-terminal domain-containing protein [Candidatus Nomurabacteria bacterium]